MKHFLFGAAVLAAALCLPAAAMARPGFTTASVHLRAGPGTYFPVIDTVPEGVDVTIHGCLADYDWCDVGWAGDRGWIFGAYLQFIYEGRPVLLPDYALRAAFPIVSFSLEPYWRHHYRHHHFYRRHSYFARRFDWHRDRHHARRAAHHRIEDRHRVEHRRAHHARHKAHEARRDAHHARHKVKKARRDLHHARRALHRHPGLQQGRHKIHRARREVHKARHQARHARHKAHRAAKKAHHRKRHAHR